MGSTVLVNNAPADVASLNLSQKAIDDANGAPSSIDIKNLILDNLVNAAPNDLLILPIVSEKTQFAPEVLSGLIPDLKVTPISSAASPSVANATHAQVVGEGALNELQDAPPKDVILLFPNDVDLKQIQDTLQVSL